MALQTDALNVITAVKYDLNLINGINRMTFLFDPNWQGIGNTLPISFFFVKSFKEVMESETSQKSLLFYNSQTKDNPDAVAGGLLGVVTDNIINRPKKYQMEIIIPRSLDVYFKQSIFSKRVTFSDLYGNKSLTGLDTTTAFFEEAVITLIKALGSTPISALQELNLSGFISESIAGVTNDSNKASLDAMWENRTILRMKYWNGWQFKYVAIENYAPSKAGEEDDVYTATLNVTEVPIMTVRKEGNLAYVKRSSVLSSFLLRAKTESVKKMVDKVSELTGN